MLNDQETVLIKGYYTLANNSIAHDLIPTEFQKKLPGSYKSIPATLLGRLAIDKRFQRQGIGKLLLIDALMRSYEVSKSIGSFAVVVDPIDEDTIRFYDKYGFIKLADSGKMFLPMNTIKTLFD
ncbi:GNAT family N-acetyltransferase [Cryomorpha ignava]|uniref:GNAT family N-acetyltransferase n=1 Tax=Cryomorpha ignava TaxID=101383 RepID=A0A7K3WWD7_9FLAO|nr:GNAT family N-acetyltransferase [Cryomorpha ignava]NEN25242.1 GNAT family N-acetyltransferase [Cryomorpha ignava]